MSALLAPVAPAAPGVTTPGFQPRPDEWEFCPACDGDAAPPCRFCHGGECECECGDFHTCGHCGGRGNRVCVVCDSTGNVANRCFEHPHTTADLRRVRITYGCGGRGFVVTDTGSLAPCERCQTTQGPGR